MLSQQLGRGRLKSDTSRRGLQAAARINKLAKDLNIGVGKSYLIINQAKEKIPAVAFETPLEELDFTERITTLLVEAGNETVGDLMLQMELDSDVILSLNGIGPKAIENIENSLSEVTFPEPVVEEVEEEAVEVEPEAEAPVEGVEAEQPTGEPEAEEGVDVQEEAAEPAELPGEADADEDQVEPAVEAEPGAEAWRSTSREPPATRRR